MPRAVVATGAAFLLLAALYRGLGALGPIHYRGRVYVSRLRPKVNWLTPGHAARCLAGILEPYAELTSSGEQLGICEAAGLDYDDAPTGTVDRTMRRCHGP